MHIFTLWNPVRRTCASGWGLRHVEHELAAGVRTDDDRPISVRRLASALKNRASTTTLGLGHARHQGGNVVPYGNAQHPDVHLLGAEVVPSGVGAALPNDEEVARAASLAP
jgi:hypothetical protein